MKKKSIKCPACKKRVPFETTIGIYSWHAYVCSKNRPITQLVLEELGGTITLGGFLKRIINENT